MESTQTLGNREEVGAHLAGFATMHAADAPYNRSRLDNWAGSGTDKISALAIGVVIGLGLGCGIGSINQTRVVRAVVEYSKRFTAGFGIGLLHFLFLFKVKNILLDLIPRQPVNEEREENYRAATRNFLRVAVTGPIVEEVKFRGIVQGLLLKATFYAMQRFGLSPKSITDPALEKILRIGVTALLFGGLHLRNGHPTARHQMILATFSGILFGVLKESKLGLFGAIGAHMANNICSYVCIQRAEVRQSRLISDEFDAQFRRERALRLEHPPLPEFYKNIR